MPTETRDGATASAPSQTPLSITWRDWLERSGWKAGTASPHAFDAIVVGSGYGGSVAALRLAQKGYRTLLLERGSEYLPGDFPNDFSLVPKAMRVNMPGQGLPVGRASGLVETHVGLGMVAITGNGLGGTSLINAGVVMEPDHDVFSQPAWPAPIRQAEAGGLGPFFALARHHLDVHEWDASLPGGGVLHKTSALKRFARVVGAEADPVAVTIDPDRCVRCGDCASGCNVPGAKRSLAATYLQQALDTGLVQIVTQAEVYRFDRVRSPGAADPSWQVHVFSTDAQHHFTAPREVFADAQPAATHRTLAAPLLFLCAGTLGTTQLMQRSQARSGGDLPLRFSPTLGTRVSGNGDSLSWLVDEPEVVASLGRGEAGVEEWQRARKLGAGKFRPAGIVGPTITAKVDLRDRDQPLDQRLVLEDGAVPRAIAQLYRELLASAHGLRQLDGWWPRRLRHPGAAQEDPLAASEGRAQQAQVLLAMGHDGSPARLVWMDGDDRAAPWLPEPDTLETYKRQQALFDRFGLRHVHSPLWRALPESAAKLMSGPKPPQTVTTVHPLGGCAMADSPAEGVVDDLGRVWAQDPGQFGRAPAGIGPVHTGEQPNVDEPQVYRGLYVLDGSIVPTSLGCNPLLTITALAERALHAVEKKPQHSQPGEPARSQPRPAEAFPSRDIPIDATLHEVLVARDVRVAGPLACLLEGDRGSGRLEADFLSADLAGDMAGADHAMKVKATLSLGTVANAEPGEVRVRYQCVGGGSFMPLPAGRWSSGPVHFAWAMAQLAFLVIGGMVAAGAVACAGWEALHAQWSPKGMALAVSAPLLLALLAIVLPMGRALLTWFVLRGRRDIAEKWKARRESGQGGMGAMDLWQWGKSLAQQMVHAAEVRVMRYRIEMDLDPALPAGDMPRKVTLLATKTVMYRASLRQVWDWWRKHEQRRDDGTVEPVPIRPTVWEQVMDAQVQVVAPGGGVIARGTFRMGFENLTSSGLSAARQHAKGALELGRNGDTTTGLMVAMGYPLLFVRYMLKTRLLDFRLPTYSRRPRPDVAPASETALRVDGQLVEPVLYWVKVDRGTSSSDRGEESTAPLRLQLRQYRQRREGAAVAPEVIPGTWMGRPVARAKAILLLHAFGQSGLTFTFKTDAIRENLAEHLYRQGHEVWILESRMSTRSGYAQDPGTVDQIAAHDIPCAVRAILEQLGKDLAGDARLAGRALQISAFAQCIGAAALWMSLLSGRLSHDPRPSAGDRSLAPRLPVLSHAVFSQVHPWIVGGRTTQAKTWVPALLRALGRRAVVPFAVRGPQDGMFAQWMDRLFASMPAPAAESRRPDGSDDGAATCRRIRFIEAPLFRHENIGPGTLEQMNLLFGDANLRLFAQARRFVDRERLVDEDGVDCYITDEAIQRHLAFPIQLLHGEQNELFDISSVHRSFERLGDFHPQWQQAFCRPADTAPPQPIVAPGYGHLDVLIGNRAAHEVFPRLSAFLRACLDRPHHDFQPPSPTGWVARAPRLGPFLGWLRDDGQGARLRMSFLLEDHAADGPGQPCPPVVLRRQRSGAGGFTRWALGLTWHVHEVVSEPQGQPGAEKVALRFAWADVPLPTDFSGDDEWEVLSLHRSWYRRPGTLPDACPGDGVLDRWLAGMGHRPSAEQVLPSVSLGPHDLSRARFKVPALSVQTLPPASEVTFAAACCRYPGLGIDQERVNQTLDEFLRTDVRRDEVAFAMLLGDQIYADATAGLVDPTSPLERYYDRHMAAFDRDGLGRLAAAMPVYMTPDDHEWADNFPAGSPLVKERWPQWNPRTGFARREHGAFRVAGKAITAFQRLTSPRHDRLRAQGDRDHYEFEHGCARFYVQDVRYSRQRNRGKIVGDDFLASLRAWLTQPQARSHLNVIACGSVILPGLRPDSDPASPGAIDTWQYAPAQRQAMLALLVDLVPGNFLLLSGDYHVSGAAQLESAGKVVGHAVVAPPLYAPLPYANSTPGTVFLDEQVDLPGRAPLVLRTLPGGEFLRGSGLGTVTVTRDDAGPGLVFQRKLWVWERGEALESVCRMPLLPQEAAERRGLLPTAV
ncbi:MULTISPECIES: alkaline phosphatase D family protein [Ramlibacter]|uniref:alkaline phosphatase D family protein n=1 Tax=Ramlibacter TaxID=174951 RepID=UPI0015EE5433|nr:MULTISPECIES: alkaline phosphatase D family protein [Ramlibacter]MBA2962453.1 alkaline phosphatase D family protein [Ramlibacter sp. CGMCC 1.13660]